MRAVTPNISVVAVRAARGPIKAGSGAMDLPDTRKADHGIGGSAGRVA